jgi:integrase/recombinase XerD
LNKTVGKSGRQISRILKKIADRAGIGKRVYPHSLRATAALCLAEQGLSAQGLCDFFGWEQLGTADSYVRRAGFGLKQELERIARKG